MYLQGNTPDVQQMDLVSWTLGNEHYDQDRKIYVDPDHPARSITAAEARCMVRKLIAGFKAMGLRRGDCVCLHAFNDIMYTMLFLGIIGAGGRFTGSNPAYTSTELSHHMRTTEARFLISEPELLPRIAPAIEECSLSVSNVFVFDPTGRDFPLYYSSWKGLMDHGESDWVKFEHVDEAKSTTAALLSTSGTTGLPKAAMISHYSCVTQNLMLNDSKNKTYTVSRILTLPEFHAFAFPIAHIAPLREGVTTYVMRRFDLNRYLSAIQQYMITETPMVPQMLKTILDQSHIARKMLKSLHLVWSAGAPLSETLQDQFYRLLNPAARVIQVWGMTEAGWISTFLWPEKGHSGSVGRLLQGMEAKLMHDDGYEIESDEISAEIFVRGPTIMQGYLGNTEASNEAFDDDGWLRTGDIAYKKQGKFFIVDRKKEMIKVRGWQVSPAELEAALLLHPDISDAAVVGTHLRQGDETEVPRAYVVKEGDSDLSECDVKRFMALRVARYKNLDGGVAIVDKIPRNSAGKILRGILRNQALTEGIEEAERKDDVATEIVKQCSEAANTSVGSSITSYDGANDHSDRSRRNSASTAGTTQSEAIGWTLKSVRAVESNKHDWKHNGTLSKDTTLTDSQRETRENEDLRSRVQNAFAEQDGRISDLTALPPAQTLQENQDVQVERPQANGKLSEHNFDPSNHLAVSSDPKKRSANDIDDSQWHSKRSKRNMTVANTNTSSEKTYTSAKAIATKESALRMN